MALQKIPLGIQVPEWSLGGTGYSYGTLTINALDEKVAFIFQAPATGSIDNLLVLPVP